MSGPYRPDLAADQFCRACGLPLPTHLRCTCCGILVGPQHVELLLAHGLCSTCVRGEPDPTPDRADRRHPRAEDGDRLPWSHATERRRSRLGER